MTDQDKATFAQTLFQAPEVAKQISDPAKRGKVVGLMAYLMSLQMCEYELLVDAVKLTSHLVSANRSSEDDSVQMNPDVEMFKQFSLDKQGFLFPLDWRLEQLLAVENPE